MKTVKEINENFDKNGVFPSDKEMESAIVGTEYRNIYELEMDLLEKASADENHPYHPSVTSTNDNGFLDFLMNELDCK